LLKQFDLPEPQALYRVHGPVNLVRLTQLIDLVDEPGAAALRPTRRYPRQVPGQSESVSSACARATC
jgi:polyphosphate kinase